MPRPNKKLMGMPVIEDRGVQYMFGQGGYIEIASNFIVAYILLEKYKLADGYFTAELPGAQQLPVSWAGLPGMMEHLKVSDTIEKQRRLSSFRRVFTPSDIPQQNQGASI